VRWEEGSRGTEFRMGRGMYEREWGGDGNKIEGQMKLRGQRRREEIT
jgi:hypothetical protein